MLLLELLLGHLRLQERLSLGCLHCHLLPEGGLLLHHHLLLRLHHLLLRLHHHLLLRLGPTSGGIVAVHDLLLLWLLHHHALKRVDVGRVLVLVHDQIVVHRGHTLLLDEVLHREQVQALLLHAHQELFLLLRPEVLLVDRHLAAHGSCLG